MKYIYVVILCISQFCFSQDLVKELQPFKSISITTAMEVELVLSDHFKIEVFGKDVAKLSITDFNKELKLTTSLTKKFKSDLKIKIYYVKGLRSIKLANHIILSSKEPIVEDFFEIKAINKVKADLRLVTKDFIATLDLGSNILLKGSTESQKINIKNKSFYDAFNFKSQKTFATVKLSKAGVYVSDFLDATAKLKGEIIYAGNPLTVHEKTFLGKVIEQSDL